MRRRLAPDGYEVRELSEGWQLASTAPGEYRDTDALDELEWRPAVVPGTVAASLPSFGGDLDERDWWFRTKFAAEPAGDHEQVVLALDGLATVADVYLNGNRLLASDSMFAAHAVDVSQQLRGLNELEICCRALAPLLAVRRRPRARWRTSLVAEANLRFFRTMLLGRAPGFAPGPPVVGPWRPVHVERRRGVVVAGLELRPRIHQRDGVLAVRAQLRGPVPGSPLPERAFVQVHGADGVYSAELRISNTADGIQVAGEVSTPDVGRWWPHTHGAPRLYSAKMLVELDGQELGTELGRVGFRELSCGEDLDRDGIQIRVNQVPVFARGAVWTPIDITRPYSTGEDLRSVLGKVVDAGMNMLRVPGIGCYESEAFYDLCDEFGILVWQDLMFANLDYPEQDAGFMATVEREVREVLGMLAGRPSLTVCCGGSEVAQQVAMLGLDPALASGPLFGELLPSLVGEAKLDGAYVPSTPSGGDLPFRPGRGVANYYGVGAYRRGIDDARRSEVRFAAECLAFSNVPDPEALEPLERPGAIAVHDPRWKATVPRDVGAGWDFEDVRDHYLRLVYELDPVALRSTDHERYLELSRAVTGEVMAEVFGEWRREASPCGGGLVLWLKDLIAGAGWGVLDSRGEPKVAYFHLRRALAPIAVWSTDEGLSGVVIHVANDGPEPLQARLRFALYRDLEVRLEEHSQRLRLGPHSSFAANLETLLGRFVDVNWAYRFGPPPQDLIVISLEQDTPSAVQLLSQAVRLPVGRPTRRELPAQLGLRAIVRLLHDTTARMTISTERMAYGVHVQLPGFRAEDDAFCVEPGRGRELQLHRTSGDQELAPGSLTALNMTGRIAVQWCSAP
jgi:beta-mannosidase